MYTTLDQLPIYTSIIFVITTLLTVGIFYVASNYSKTTLVILISWLTLQAIIGLTGFYTSTQVLPPRFILLVFPPLLFIILLFITPKGKVFIDKLDIKILTLLHIIRIPVELVLYMLFIHKAVPELMTFEGRNLDIISGITAPFVYYFGFIKKGLGKKVMLIWNFICLGLLINIVVHAVLSAPFAFQQFAFDQPNIAVLYFPFNWLPCCVVPLVLFSHLTTIKQLMLTPKTV